MLEVLIGSPCSLWLREQLSSGYSSAQPLCFLTLSLFSSALSPISAGMLFMVRDC